MCKNALTHLLRRDCDASIKRLESGAFQKPTADPKRTQMEIDVTQLSLIINGIDLASAKRRRRYQRAV